ncbi:MAG: hypothetical protein RSE07_01995 [Oscillospiraceae bacterium]
MQNITCNQQILLIDRSSIVEAKPIMQYGIKQIVTDASLTPRVFCIYDISTQMDVVANLIDLLQQESEIFDSETLTDIVEDYITELYTL